MPKLGDRDPSSAGTTGEAVCKQQAWSKCGGRDGGEPVRSLLGWLDISPADQLRLSGTLLIIYPIIR